MKQTEMRCVDYLDWLREQEEWVLYQLDMESLTSPVDRIELGEELQMIREIKQIVTTWGGQDD